jgi:hypothetical protein
VSNIRRAHVIHRSAALALAAGLVVLVTACETRRVATVAGQSHADVDACLAAGTAVAERRRTRTVALAPNEPSDAAVVAAACAPLFREPACRDAHLHFDDPPVEMRATTVLKACREAYCPKLGPPLPRACDPKAEDSDDPMAVFQSWHDLRTAIYRRDLGDAETERILAAEGR